MTRRAALAGMAGGLCAALRPAALRAQPAGAPLLVFAAASLQGALDAVGAAWSAQGGTRPSISYAGTPALARQIEQGAPADLLIAADSDWMDRLERRGALRPGSRVDLLGNRLVLVAPQDRPVALRIAPGMDLLRALGGGRLALADVGTVPAGRYAKAALEALGVWPSVAGRVAGTENVRAALALVARGEAPLGIVYASDARAEPRVRVVDVFPAGLHPPIVYPAAVTAASRSPQAGAFAAFLRSPPAAAAFVAQGFEVLAR
jgi:molybdate transport system substrate-binding protein